jgi:stearoyl-CoA desaturase (Delta-9 desaturase)
MSTVSSEKKLNKVNLVFFIITPIIGIAGLLYWLWSGSANWATALFGFALMTAAGMSITAGYHRLFSHRSYNTNRFIEALYIFFGSANFEGSVIEWAGDHRIHHRYQDKDEDPYAIHKGFWFAHLGWIFTKDWASDLNKVRDLWSNPLIRFQHTYFVYVASFAAFVFPMLVCGLLWGDWVGGLFVAGVFRMVLNQHFTFLINSLCHFAGSRPYSDNITARNNWLTAIFTYGEGYHNFHHEFPGDYRNGVRRHELDPTKWLIFALSKVGLASRLHRVSPEKILQRRVAMQEKELRNKIHLASPALTALALETIERAKLQFHEASERLALVRSEYQTAYTQWKNEKTESLQIQKEDLRQKFLDAQKEFRESYLMWKAMRSGLGKMA